MVYTMRMKVDGGCRGNGYDGAVGAAAVIIEHKYGGRWTSWTKRLPTYPRPTSQRAELAAIVLALEKALEKQRQLDRAPFMKVAIRTDSKYAHGCMTDWSFKWLNNGWINCAGNEVANRDLVEEALELEAELEENGDVQYEWIPRDQNQDADEAVNDKLDEMSNDSY